MAKPELGQKRICVSCSAKFYDLNRSPAVCPKCSTEQPVEIVRPRRPSSNVTEQRVPKKPLPPVADDPETEAEVVSEDTEEEGDALEDATELEDDADELIIEVETEQGADERER